MVTYTVTQKERLSNLDAKAEEIGASFADEGQRNEIFRRMEADYVKKNKEKIRGLLAEKHATDAYFIQQRLENWLMNQEGFTRVSTPTIITSQMLDRMTIDEGNPLRSQVFWLDEKKCLRPMLAPNLYIVMGELRRITGGPVKIFEVGSCFRRESQGAEHMNEFTMLNFVEFDGIADGCQMERLEFMARAAMAAAEINNYELRMEKSSVYGETLDIISDGVEIASGSFGPHKLDANWGIFHSWIGLGIGIERIAMIKGGCRTIKKTGKSISFIDGAPLSL